MLCLNWKLRSWIGTFASLVECKLKCEFIECLFQFAWNHFFLAKAFLRHFFMHRSHRSANCCRVFDAAFSRSLLAYRTYNSKQTDKQPNLFAQIPTTFFHCRFSGLWHIECDIFSTPFKSQCSIFFCSLLILRGLHPRIMAAANRCSCQMDLCANIRSGFHSTLLHSAILYMYTFPLRYGEVFCVWIVWCTLMPTTQQPEWEMWKRADFSCQKTRFLRVISVFIFHVCRNVSSDDQFSSFSAFIHENGSRTTYGNVWRCAKYSISRWQKMKKKRETSNTVAHSST